MGDTSTIATTRRWFRVTWAINALLVLAGSAVISLSDVSVSFAVGWVAIIVLVNIGIWIALRRAVARGSDMSP